MQIVPGELITKLVGLAEGFADLLYPPRCCFCGKLLQKGEKGSCRKCYAALPLVPSGTARSDIPNVTICVAPLFYEGRVREALLRYKFEGVTAYKRTFSEFVAKCVDENGFSCDSITWVPLSRRRRFRRGYDQARLIAEELSKKLGVPCVSLLKKTRNTPPQSSQSSTAERKRNAAGVYRCIDAEKTKNRRILLIDDIVTTGATVSECAGMLREAGAAEIYAAAVAMGR